MNINYSLFFCLFYCVLLLYMENHNTMVLGRVFAWVDLNLFYHVWFCYKIHKRTREQQNNRQTNTQMWRDGCFVWDKVKIATNMKKLLLLFEMISLLYVTWSVNVGKTFEKCFKCVFHCYYDYFYCFNVMNERGSEER